MTSTSIDSLKVPLAECPEWCTSTDQHVSEHPEDRYCHSPFFIVANKLARPAQYGEREWRFSHLNVWLRREWRETNVHLVLHSEDSDKEITLTLSEAADLASTIDKVLEMADLAVTA